LNRSSLTRAALSAPLATAASMRALMRSRASSSRATMTIWAKDSFGWTGWSPSQNRGELLPI
jgi:hypothetical protein